MSISLLNLKNRCRERANMENSRFVEDTSELTYLINTSIQEVHDLLIMSFGEEYSIKVSDIYQLTNGEDTYALSDIAEDFYKLLAFDFRINGNEWINLQKMNLQDRNKFQYNVLNNHPYYMIMGNNVVFRPLSSINMGTIRMWYFPTATILVDDEDTLEGMDAYLDYIALSVAIKMLNKEETDTTQFLREKAELKQQIIEAANMKDMGQGTSIGDVSKVSSPYEYYNFDL